jgi:hypothetical protein
MKASSTHRKRITKFTIAITLAISSNEQGPGVDSRHINI